MNNLIIRKAMRQDGDAARKLVFDILEEYRVPADPEDSDADIMEFGEPTTNALHYVLVDGADVVGTAILTPSKNNKVKLSKLFLKKEYRQKGNGRKMLTAVIENATKEGFCEIYLGTRALYKEAVHLYETTGWLRGPDQPGPGPDRLYYYPLNNKQ